MKAWSLIAFCAAVALANFTTANFGMLHLCGLSVTAGTIWAGVALVSRDAVQERNGTRVALLAIIPAAVLSAITSTPALALASCLAFLASELSDLLVYTKLRHRSRPLAVLASSAAASPVDTVLFLHLAGFPITSESISGQVIMKTVIALLAAAGIRWRSTSRAA